MMNAFRKIRPMTTIRMIGKNSGRKAPSQAVAATGKGSILSKGLKLLPDWHPQ
jgi:hypothetical protein